MVRQAHHEREDGLTTYGETGHHERSEGSSGRKEQTPVRPEPVEGPTIEGPVSQGRALLALFESSDLLLYGVDLAVRFLNQAVAPLEIEVGERCPTDA